MRGPGTLMLCHAWVDVTVVKGLIDTGGQAMRLGHTESVIGRARAVERLYHGDSTPTTTTATGRWRFAPTSPPAGCGCSTTRRSAA